MREIKFRAWDGQQMHYDVVVVDGIGYKRGSIGMIYAHGARAGIPMQYTGLKDRNDKEIYEGDIAKSGKRLFVARWNNDIASFVWEPLDGESSYPCFNVGTVKNMEIVGNVFENPELLEGEE